MAVVNIEVGISARLARTRELLGMLGLFGILAAFTLATQDGLPWAPRAISTLFLILAAVYLSVPFAQRLYLNVPVVCLLCMTLWGVVQTLFFPQKIVALGWGAVLYWFTAAMICLIATQLFRAQRAAAQFRYWLLFFGAALCLLELLEQASHTSQYFWLIQSKYHSVFGSFAYWNNFAQFIELVLPITLWYGLSRRYSSPVPYLLLSALEIGAVVASGSRAGAVLVVAELVAIILLAYWQRRDNKLLLIAGGALALSLLFVYAAGFDVLIQKLQQNDQLAVRRLINQSSLEMISMHPFTGWGLGTYVPVYRMFAHYDDGTFVNQAHNDWLEWAAGGGVFFAGAMLVLFAWSLRPAIRSVWGIGLIAICLHALVDYPFARLGVCGWYFALVPMLAAENQSERDSVPASESESEKEATV